MSAHMLILWSAALFLGLAGGMMMRAPDSPTATFEASLGPDVRIEPIAQ